MNPNSPKFYVPSVPNLLHRLQCTNPNNEQSDQVPHIPRNLNNQLETTINPVSPYSTSHRLYPIIVKPPGTSYPKTKAGNSVKSDNNLIDSISAFIDELVEGEETVF